MRSNRALLIALVLTALVLPLASPDAAASTLACKKTYANLGTTYVDDFVEVGEIEGTINGTAYLRYDDKASPIDPGLDSANFVITSKDGDIHLWVYDNASDDMVWREFSIMQAAGTGIYTEGTVDLQIYGKFDGKGGNYVIEGSICPLKSAKR